MTQMENILYPQKLHIFHGLTKLNFTYTSRPTKAVKRLQIFLRNQNLSLMDSKHQRIKSVLNL